MKRFALTPLAKQDVNDIWNYIADDNTRVAVRVLDAFESSIIKLLRTPASAIVVRNWQTSGTGSFWSIRT